MRSIGYVEIPVDNFSRAQEFYSEIFGWRFRKMSGQEEIEYYSIQMSDEDDLAAGMIKRQYLEDKSDCIPVCHTNTFYISVDSIDEKIKNIKELKGQQMVKKTFIKDIGHFAIFLDTENNMFGLWESLGVKS
jgi:predicted enzyme related to lactoylglutathione lyase